MEKFLSIFRKSLDISDILWVADHEYDVIFYKLNFVCSDLGSINFDSLKAKGPPLTQKNFFENFLSYFRIILAYSGVFSDEDFENDTHSAQMLTKIE